MARLLRMPEVAANATEAVLQEWAVPEGAPFSAEDPLATVETEKAVVDVEADADGVVLKTLVPPGAQVEVGAPIAVLGEPDEQVDDLDFLLAELGVVAGAPAVAPERRMVPDDPEGGTADTRTFEPEALAPEPRTPRRPPGNGQPSVASATPDGGRIFASPLARRLAREAGLSVAEISGTGPGGRIIRRDVEAALAGRTGVQEAAPSAGQYADIPHSRMRRAIATRLAESQQTVPHFYLRATVRVDRLLKLRDKVNPAAATKVSLNDLLVKAAACAHTLVPEMNVVWTPEAVRQFHAVDVGVAVATDRGLVTPVLRGVDTMSVSTVAATIGELVARARSGELRQHELEGGALSVSNLGMYGVEEFAAIINPPQSAILALGAARQEPVVRKGRLRTGAVMRVTLSVDHRAVDGVLAARWMQAFVSVVENPLQILT
ncbi:MAG: dihydrolipoamide acetyltransferase family protein [Nocardioidaceae bacterium]